MSDRHNLSPAEMALHEPKDFEPLNTCDVCGCETAPTVCVCPKCEEAEVPEWQKRPTMECPVLTEERALDIMQRRAS